MQHGLGIITILESGVAFVFAQLRARRSGVQVFRRESVAERIAKFAFRRRVLILPTNQPFGEQISIYHSRNELRNLSVITGR